MNPWSFMFRIRFWPMTASPMTAMSAFDSMIVRWPNLACLLEPLEEAVVVPFRSIGAVRDSHRHGVKHFDELPGRRHVDAQIRFIESQHHERLEREQRQEHIRIDVSHDAGRRNGGMRCEVPRSEQ